MEFILDLIEVNTKVPYQILFGLIILGLLFLWISLPFWVWLDSSRYFKKTIPRLLFCVLTILFGFIGIIIYLLFRFVRSDNINSLNYKEELMALGITVCPSCSRQNFLENKFCSSCGNKLHRNCKKCGEEIFRYDLFCPKCGVRLKIIKNDGNDEKKIEKFLKLRYIDRVFNKAQSIFLFLLRPWKFRKGVKKVKSNKKT